VGGWWTQSYVLFSPNISIGVWLDDVSQFLDQIWTPTRFLEALAIMREPKSKLLWKNQEKRELRATLHMRLRARDHYTSSTLIGGKGGAGPSSLHTMLEAPTEYVNARWI
jgi:hypothetical protein